MTREKPLSLVAQHLMLVRTWPGGRGFIAPSSEGRRLRWYQTIRPHVLCGRYEIELRYAENHLPVILVRAPNIQLLAGDRRLPHVYPSVDGLPSLCLWWKGDWKPSRPVATTIIPWAAEWFWFFEQWLASGEWMGGGTHPVEFAPPIKPEIQAA